MRILSIETSCDETAIAIADFKRGKNGVSVRVLSHLISSQTKLHAKFGGGVPNLARREHEKNLVPMLLTALRESGSKNQEPRKRYNENVFTSCFLILDSILTRESSLLVTFKKHARTLFPPPDIDAIAVTYGPGLAPALWTGVNFARALATLWHKPLIPVNHMAGHFFSAFLNESGMSQGENSIRHSIFYHLPTIKFPVLALLVSGNHTEIILVKKPWQFNILGQTHDDAAGEAFDKIARVMGFPYPGGPAISRLAEKGNAKNYPLPSPMIHSKDYDFSFSGLKTAALYRIRDITGSVSWQTKAKLTPKQKADIAASFENAAINVLVKKTIRAAKEYKVKTLLLGGGVSANALLRQEIRKAIKEHLQPTTYHLPPSNLTGDNALMIATAAYFCNHKSAPDKVRADANLRLEER
ncbi:MAG: tRNA (adenosine(37)-N6)-threonylcarbamoyltransferase complex transferase subunit TsaD [Candidatus Sungbacteria bacterium]|nr:tRNA (adenosine(37)-N6)-threonylcarbamoyltransferase complex transferase subunit TsaD [Candidatus Sungbacteria bacterium]